MLKQTEQPLYLALPVDTGVDLFRWDPQARDSPVCRGGMAEAFYPRIGEVGPSNPCAGIIKSVVTPHLWG